MTEGAEPRELEEPLRRRFAELADALIPGADGMPAPSSIGIGAQQLDVVLSSRPDLADGLRRALASSYDERDPIGWVETLAGLDPPAYEALVTAVVAGYYMHADVKRRLGYPGQTGQAVRGDAFPDYLTDGLLERVYERGPIYRPTPGEGAPESP